ncbi:MAG: NAD-glutamate dehydrogenase [Ilumatobacter sp.]|nr:MAG: NAD-glutamate dehydrogenase [Ilumatobacter sp.]
MSTEVESSRRDVIPISARLARMARERRPDDPVLVDFLEEYYRELPDADVDERQLDDVYAVALVHYLLGRDRQWGDTRVEVRSPDRDVDGWYSTRSVLLVVTDDAPFLVDTIRMVLDRRRIRTHLLVHPMLDVDRDDQGRLTAVRGGRRTEAWTQIEIDRCDHGFAQELAVEIDEMVEEVHRVVADFQEMRARLAGLAHEDPLLAWLADGNFVFLGAATYDRTHDGGLVVRPGTELGQLRRPHDIDPPAVPIEASDRTAVVIARSDAVSTIHRAARRTSISVRAGDGARHRFVGLLASGAYRQSVMSIPSVGDRTRAILGLTSDGAETHTGRSARNVIETLPRDLVFELTGDALAHLVIDIVGIQERQIVRVFDVPEPVGDWSTVLVYVPRSRFDAQMPAAVAAVVAEAYGTPYRDLESLVGNSSLARITFTVRRTPEFGVPDLDWLAERIDELTTSWADRVLDALVRQLGGQEGRRLAQRFLDVMPADYAAHVSATRAVSDLVRLDELLDSDHVLATAMSREIDAPTHEWRFRVFRRGQAATLAELLPVLGHLGLAAIDERPATIAIDGEEVHLYDIGVRLPVGVDIDPGRHAEIQRTFEALMAGEVEADGLNRLVALAGLDRREVAILRTYVRFLRQIGFAFSLSYIEATLARLPGVARGLVFLFEQRFQPGVSEREAAVDAARTALLTLIDEIQVLDEDRICRTLLALIEATLRTNAYGGRAPIAFKFDPSAVPGLPEPRPMFEIFVCSPDVEGVHLRAGPIARGGLRWSDRREDFRTEVLGLVKAQIVKNAVIVPVGAKGGFVVKNPPDDPSELRTHATECYREFIRSLLDVSDDIIDGEIRTPPAVVRYDGLDPYLVVAADKGTATFSDVANGVADEYGFWLGDAFASGGSVGYDHKAMGITARGAWESVRRHASALGKHAEIDPLTVVGIGDMSGDVFGNGMLRSEQLRLVAAFDHRHIFLDPDPDPSVSFAERRRLFELPRSSWADYDSSLISDGGGVYPRSVKSITLSPEARAALGTDAERMTPLELIRVILTAPVDLLWNGGIGTYVKASSESHADVGDRANDGVRVDATDLRCRIVGEGGNLGFTQRARIEFALAGGLVNTDAIDNSAGVDCSDHEVNIKILLDEVVAAGQLTVLQRNELLASMTDEVAELVLDNNRAQSLALMIARRQALPMVNVHARYLDLLESEGWLDRELEFLPTDKEISERQADGQGLVTPEFAVLIAYTKNADVAELLASDLPDDPALEDDLVRYFPEVLRDRFGHAIRSHRLRREIIATQIVNQMVNLSGISFDHRMTEDTGASIAEVVRSWVAAREIFSFPTRWTEIDQLVELDLDTRLELLLACRRTAERCALWILRNRRHPLDISDTVSTFRADVSALESGLSGAVTGPMADAMASTAAQRIEAGVPVGLAHRASVWPLLHTCFDVVEIARHTSAPATAVADAYWGVFARLELMWLWNGVGALPRSDRWQTQARSALRDDLIGSLAELAATVMTESDGSVEHWHAANERTVARTMSLFTEIRRADHLDLTTLSVALRQLRNLGLTSVRHRQP